jgi:hypothetical protein
MTTYVWRNGELVEKYKAPPKSGVSIMSDIQPFVTQDGTAITSRSSLRAYEQRHGVKQVGNDYASMIQRIKERQ